jgi:adenylylsulfate kinase-like enzyme
LTGCYVATSRAWLPVESKLEDHPLLIAFGGLPGTGKTTLAKAIAKRYSAVYLRIDTIEMAIRTTGILREDIPLTWANICHRTYEEWSAPHLVIDTAGKSVAETEQELIDRLSAADHLKMVIP